MHARVSRSMRLARGCSTLVASESAGCHPWHSIALGRQQYYLDRGACVKEVSAGNELDINFCRHHRLTPLAWKVLLLCAGSTASLAAFHALKAVPFAAPTKPFTDFIRVCCSNAVSAAASPPWFWFCKVQNG